MRVAQKEAYLLCFTLKDSELRHFQPKHCVPCNWGIITVLMGIYILEEAGNKDQSAAGKGEPMNWKEENISRRICLSYNEVREINNS